jgi:hypothetical protein
MRQWLQGTITIKQSNGASRYAVLLPEQEQENRRIKMKETTETAILSSVKVCSVLDFTDSGSNSKLF